MKKDTLTLRAQVAEKHNLLSCPRCKRYDWESEVEERFHELTDKELMGNISDAERSELTRLEFAFREAEDQDGQEQALREEWSRRLDRAIKGLTEINQKLTLLVSSGE